MVFVIVEIAQEDIGDIITRLLGAKHRIQVVEDLKTACGCEAPVKRVRLETPPPPQKQQPSPHLQYSNPVLHMPMEQRGDVKVFLQQTPQLMNSTPSAMHEETRNTVNFSLMDSVGMVPSSSHQDPAAMLNSALKEVSGFSNSQKIAFNSASSRRNNGVPYNSGILYPHIRKMDGVDDEPKEEYAEGVDMAIKCALCDRTIALGTRPANHSTRKYAHARCHGFKNRFECNLCHAVFKNKRVTMNHNRTVHGEDPRFEVIDKWNEAAQRDLMIMVRKCFPKTAKPFVKLSMGSIEDDAEEANEELLIAKEEEDGGEESNL